MGLPLNKMAILTLAVIGALIGVFLLVILAVTAWRLCFPKKKTFIDLDFEEVEGVIHTRSEPSTRNSSPKISPRKEHSKSRGDKAKLIRSLTADMIPDLNLPPERVQPKSRVEHEHVHSHSMDYHEHLIGSINSNINNNAKQSREDATEEHYEPGLVWFSVKHDAMSCELSVHVARVNHLPQRRNSLADRDLPLENPNSYVRVCLLPDETTAYETSHKKNTTSPRFSETFVFKVTSEEVRQRILRLSVYDEDRRRVRHTLGHVYLPLRDASLDTEQVITKRLRMAAMAQHNRGEINVSLTYVPSTDKVKIGILRARKLNNFPEFLSTASYVRVQLKQNNSIIKSKHTSYQKGTFDPVYNESFTFKIDSEDLNTYGVVITLVLAGVGKFKGHDRDHGNLVIGSVLHADSERQIHWQQMMIQPRIAHAHWHVLDPIEENE